MRSFRFKILALVAALVTLSQIATLVAVLVTANRDVSDRSKDRLDVGAAVFDQFMRSRDIQLRTTVRVLTADFGFKKAVATMDTETIRSVLANHSRRASADCAFLIGMDGGLIATTEEAGADLADEVFMLMETADDTGAVAWTLDTGDQAYEMVTVPVSAPLPIAYVSMGFRIDHSLAQKVKSLTGLEMTILNTDLDGKLVVIGSSLDPANQTLLKNILVDTEPGYGQTAVLELGDLPFLTLRRPFAPDSEELTAVLQQSLHKAMAPYRKLRLAIVSLGSLALIVALMGAVLLSRTVTRPVQNLVQAARRIKIGDYTKAALVETRDELGELAETFNAMRDGIAERERRITHAAMYDSLTGLPNRLQARDHLQQALQRAESGGEHIAVLLLDLDRFRDITSSLGHAIGEEVLRQIAQRLRSGLDDNHLLARLEADEFAIVLESADLDTAMHTAEHLLLLLGGGVSIDAIRVTLTASIGICIYPDHADDTDQLLRRAAIAKSESKVAKSHICVYQQGREERYVRQLEIVGDLGRAARQNEFRLLFQPKLSLADGRVDSVEALLRWQHPRLGMIPPSDFVQIAEQSGNITLVTQWVVRNAVQECRTWLDNGIDLTVSVNVSRNDLADENLPYFIREVLQDNSVDARHLMLEVTENAFMQDVSHAIILLECMRDLGIKVSIDDFGTGYSSLEQIKRLPVDELKIDQSFLTNIPGEAVDTAIVRSTIELAHNLGLKVVAEGVRTAEALRWLAAQGCEQAQGFYISKPLSADALIVWIQSRLETPQDETASNLRLVPTT